MTESSAAPVESTDAPAVEPSVHEVKLSAPWLLNEFRAEGYVFGRGLYTEVAADDLDAVLAASHRYGVSLEVK